jgi:hypothetical protein
VYITDSQHGQARIRTSHSDKQLTRSLVTACKACAGSTTAASKASSRPDVEHQKKQLPFDTQRTHSSLTVPQIIQQTNQGIESLEAEEGGKVEQPWPGGEGQAPEAYQEEKSKQESNQEEKGKLEANHHSSASSSSPISRPQLQNSSQKVDNLASHISLPVHEIMHSWVL